MNNRIEVGMVVQVFGIEGEWSFQNGLIGRVTELFFAYDDGTMCAFLDSDDLRTIPGNDEDEFGFGVENLRPIPDDSAFDSFMGEVFKPVDIGNELSGPKVKV